MGCKLALVTVIESSKTAHFLQIASIVWWLTVLSRQLDTIFVKKAWVFGEQPTPIHRLLAHQWWLIIPRLNHLVVARAWLSQYEMKIRFVSHFHYCSLAGNNPILTVRTIIFAVELLTSIGVVIEITNQFLARVERSCADWVIHVCPTLLSLHRILERPGHTTALWRPSLSSLSVRVKT